MRKVLLVVVIAGAACLEPVSQTPVSTPVSTGTDEPMTSAPRGHLETVVTQGPHRFSDREQTFGPVIASGTEAGHPWSLRGRIGALHTTIFWETSTGGGGGGGGALPFAVLPWKKLGHFGSVGSGEHRGQGVPRMLRVDGVVSKQTATIEVQLSDGTSLPAQIVDTGDPRASFFVAVWSAPVQWEVVIARDAAGAELETYRQPPPQALPTQAPPTPASGTSTP